MKKIPVFGIVSLIILLSVIAVKEGMWGTVELVGHYIYVVLNFLCMCFNWVVGIG
ncbi:MAG: hypothetical protein PHS79_03900 [Patescibacteria group bacterium]|nr:hypothetical protein [Patescibacteria group bacterium]